MNTGDVTGQSLAECRYKPSLESHLELSDPTPRYMSSLSDPILSVGLAKSLTAELNFLLSLSAIETKNVDKSSYQFSVFAD
jgi:hypothetical protein